jgi:undecaprenyl diphosphate synthase
MSSVQPPQHLAIIMDGNGRWAKSRGYTRAYGHVRGARVAKKMVEKCATDGVQFLTLYAFSTENWMRPKAEVHFLMQLLARHLKKEREALVRNNIRFQTIGEISLLPAAVQKEVATTIAATSACDGMTLIFALSYGGRQEITRAFKEIAEQIQKNQLSLEDISEKLIEKHLSTQNIPDPDLIIRTSGEYRLSNFLLWQAAYSEFYITPTLWPDFKESDLEASFQFYATRERRFGKTSEQLVPNRIIQSEARIL